MNITAWLADKPDQGLHQQKGGRGFPYVVFLDEQGGPLISTNPIDQSAFMKDLTRAKEMTRIYREFAKKPNSRKAKAEALLLDFRLDRKKVPLKELEKAARVGGVDKELVRFFKDYSKTKSIKDVVEALRKQNTADNREKAMADMYALYKKGEKIEDPDDGNFLQYWMLAFDGAVAAKDAKTGKKMLKEFRKTAPAKFAFLAKRMEQDLKEM